VNNGYILSIFSESDVVDVVSVVEEEDVDEVVE
jgi:hypothetical protein